MIHAIFRQSPEHLLRAPQPKSEISIIYNNDAKHRNTQELVKAPNRSSVFIIPQIEQMSNYFLTFQQNCKIKTENGQCQRQERQRLKKDIDEALKLLHGN